MFKKEAFTYGTAKIGVVIKKGKMSARVTAVLILQHLIV